MSTLSSEKVLTEFKELRDSIFDLLLNDGYGECFDSVCVDGDIVTLKLGSKVMVLDFTIKDIVDK